MDPNPRKTILAIILDDYSKGYLYLLRMHRCWPKYGIFCGIIARGAGIKIQLQDL